MTHNSCKAWKTIRKLSNDPTMFSQCKAKQVAHELIVNGRSNMRSKLRHPVLPPATEGDASMVYPSSEEESRKGVTGLKNEKAAGRDYVFVEQLNNIGPKPHRSLLTMLLSTHPLSP